MRIAGIVLCCMVIAAIGLLVLGGVGHRDEVSYVLQGGRLDDDSVSINVQNTGSVLRYLGLVGVRRYGPPFELFIWIEPRPGTESVVLRELEVLDGDRPALAVAEAELPVEPVAVFQGGRQTERESAVYAHPEDFELQSETVTVRGSLIYRSAGGDEEAAFVERFERRHEGGFYTGL